MKNPHLQQIYGQFDLRRPLRSALEVLDNIVSDVDIVNYTPSVSDGDWLAELRQTKPPFRDFMRTFPSFTFDIATGVGKTRLMAAMLVYLHRSQGVRNFFILAPNLTIYKKLIADFGQPESKKYLFRGVSDFVTKDIRIVTGDNFNDQGQSLFQADVVINVFNIAKFNTEEKTNKKTGKTSRPLIKRLGETLGESYWQFLKNCPDLVLLMDEAHRYVADASLAALNDLNPRIGLEMTATPLDAKKQEFTNRVYTYNLKNALDDRQFVKRPMMVTRTSFDKSGMDKQQIDRYILKDALSLHEKIRTELQNYAVEQAHSKTVKPLMLICCPNTDHANEIFEYLTADTFENGNYRAKVLNINTKTYNDDVEAQFVALEEATNPIEIVIHVMMLAEGWDVSNLYTIVPLRAADSIKLVKQTLGRGLRLPFGGTRTGVKDLDTLSIVDHDNFADVVNALQAEGVLDTEGVHDLDKDKTPKREPRQANGAPLTDSEKATLMEALKAQMPVETAATTVIEPEVFDRAYEVLTQSFERAAAAQQISDHAALSSAAGQEEVMKWVEKSLNEGQLSMDAAVTQQACAQAYGKLTEKYLTHAIEIPRLVVKPKETRVWFDDFDLDTSRLNFKMLKAKFLRQEIGGEAQRDTVEANSTATTTTADRNLMQSLRRYADINYQQDGDLLRKLIHAACSAITASLAENSLLDVVVNQYKTDIVADIYNQIQKHKHTEGGGVEVVNIVSFTRLLQDSFSPTEKEKARSCTHPVKDKSEIRQYVFKGFQKTNHAFCRFDSDAERSLAVVMSFQSELLSWLRPMPKQFNLRWQAENGAKSGNYEPDFVAEGKDKIYLVEVKADNQTTQDEVKAKRQVAEQYCAEINRFLAEKGKKIWQYVLIPSSKISDTSDFEALIREGLRQMAV